jgi:hypothetical protein
MLMRWALLTPFSSLWRDIMRKNPKMLRLYRDIMGRKATFFTPLMTICALLIIFSCSGCTAFSGWSGKVGTAQPRILPSEIARREIVVSRSELKKRLEQRGVADGVRMIPITQGQSSDSDPAPAYRIFGVKAGGVYELVGIEQADVILSAHGYVIREAWVFPEYLRLLAGESSGTIEIVRNKVPLLLAITVKD